MPATPAERRQAQRQANQVDRINRKGAAFVRRYTEAINAATLAAAAKGKQLVLPAAAVELVVDELVVFSVAAYLASIQNYQPTSVALAVSFGTELKRIAKGFDINIGTLSKQMRDVAGPNIRESLHSVKKRINETLSEVSAAKLTTKEANRVLTDRLNEMGVTPRNKSYAETLVRTHGQLSWGAAQSKVFQSDEDLWGYEYVTVGDDRVREDHERLDGLVRKKDDPIWKTIFPPNGWNCRCQVLAIYEPIRQTPIPSGAKDLVDPSFRFDPGRELG